jgi:hypothetical protein
MKIKGVFKGITPMHHLTIVVSSAVPGGPVVA